MAVDPTGFTNARYVAVPRQVQNQDDTSSLLSGASTGIGGLSKLAKFGGFGDIGAGLGAAGNIASLASAWSNPNLSTTQKSLKTIGSGLNGLSNFSKISGIQEAFPEFSSVLGTTLGDIGLSGLGGISSIPIASILSTGANIGQIATSDEPDWKKAADSANEVGSAVLNSFFPGAGMAAAMVYQGIMAGIQQAFAESSKTAAQEHAHYASNTGDVLRQILDQVSRAQNPEQLSQALARIYDPNTIHDVGNIQGFGSQAEAQDTIAKLLADPNYASNIKLNPRMPNESLDLFNDSLQSVIGGQASMINRLMQNDPTALKQMGNRQKLQNFSANLPMVDQIEYSDNGMTLPVSTRQGGPVTFDDLHNIVNQWDSFSPAEQGYLKFFTPQIDQSINYLRTNLGYPALSLRLRNPSQSYMDVGGGGDSGDGAGGA